MTAQTAPAAPLPLPAAPPIDTLVAQAPAPAVGVPHSLLLMEDYSTLPLASLTIDHATVRLDEPYFVGVAFFANGHYLNTNRREQGDALIGRNIVPDDLLIFDYDRTTPEDGVIMLVEDGREFVARVCRVLGAGFVEFHAAAPGYPILSGERKIYGTLAAVIRTTDGRDAAADTSGLPDTLPSLPVGDTARRGSYRDHARQFAEAQAD